MMLQTQQPAVLKAPVQAVQSPTGPASPKRSQQRRAAMPMFGNYILGPSIGEGSYGIVRLAAKVEEGQAAQGKPQYKYALKLLRRHKFIASEVELQSTVSHNNIAKIYEVLKSNSLIGIVMEHCGGGDLFEVIRNNGGIMDIPRALFIFRQIVAAVLALHRAGIAHLDLKLENFLISSDGRAVKLCDFGAAQNLQSGPITRCVKGDRSAPEQWTCEQYDGFKADVYQLGKAFHEILFGLKAPGKHGLEPPQGYAVPSRIAEILNGMLHHNPDSRWSLDQAWSYLSTERGVEQEVRIQSRGKAAYGAGLQEAAPMQMRSSRVANSQCHLIELPNHYQRHGGLTHSESAPIIFREDGQRSEPMVYAYCFA